MTRPLPTLRQLQKAAKRVVDPNAGRTKLIAEGACRACGRRLPARLLERHHLVPRSLGGDDLDANLIPLGSDFACGCHGRFERSPQRSMVGAAIRRNLHPVEVDYILAKKGADHLARYYPTMPDQPREER